jgi:hypothetical protein
MTGIWRVFTVPMLLNAPALGIHDRPIVDVGSGINEEKQDEYRSKSRFFLET